MMGSLFSIMHFSPEAFVVLMPAIPRALTAREKNLFSKEPGQ